MASNILDYLYGILTSTKTTIVLFAILFLFFLVGNVLPYGGSYEQIKVTGFTRTIIEGLDLLNVYSGPWFLTTAGLLFLNLSLCTYKRTMWMIRVRRPAELAATTLSAHRDTLELELPYSPKETTSKVEAFFRKRLFFKKPSTTRGKGIYSGGVHEQGFIHYIWLSLAFHVSVILAVIGATITFLFSFENEVTIFPDAPVEIATVSPDTRWNKWYGQGEDFIISEDEKFNLGLKEFSIKYTQRPSITDFPRRGIIPRLKETWGLGGLTVVAKEGQYYPIEYASQLVIYENGEPAQEPYIKVNIPLRYRGLTFYQSAYEYKYDLYADNKKIEEKEEGKYILPGIEGEFEAGYVTAGKLYLKDGSVCVLEPFIKLTYTPPESEQETTKTSKEHGSEVFKLIEGKTTDIKGTKVRIENIRAATILSYRHDPGVPLLWIAAPVLFFGMLFRAWGRWCRASYIVEKRPKGSRLLVHLQMFGVWGGERNMIERLKSSLVSDE
ncbi:MAG: cytochrome c biogenesis protein ResB [Candidatus Brocadiales bacterium]